MNALVATKTKMAIFSIKVMMKAFILKIANLVFVATRAFMFHKHVLFTLYIHNLALEKYIGYF